MHWCRLALGPTHKGQVGRLNIAEPNLPFIFNPRFFLLLLPPLVLVAGCITPLLHFELWDGRSPNQGSSSKTSA